MNTKTFDWAFTEMNRYIAYKYLGQFYLHGLHILPIFSPLSLQPLMVPPLGNQLCSFVDSYIHHTTIHQLVLLYHWKHGDRIHYQNETYLLGVMNLVEGSVTR